MNTRLLGVLSGMAALAIAATSSYAAEFPAQKAPGAPGAATPAFTWTGFYIGAHAGYGWSDSGPIHYSFLDPTILAPDIAAGFLPLRQAVGGRDGFLGGAQIGYNFQTGAFVWGIEADFSLMDAGGSNVLNIDAPQYSPGRFMASHDLEYLGTIRGRIGVAFDRILVYATGGLAYGEVRFAVNYGFPTDNDLFVVERSRVEPGWIVGGGIEYALADNLILKAEYLTYDLGGRTVVPLAPVPGFIPFEGIGMSAGYETRGRIARIGMNYKF